MGRREGQAERQAGEGMRFPFLENVYCHTEAG